MSKGIMVLLVLFAFYARAGAATDEVSAPVADGFDFPVGKPNAVGYYKARGFQAHGHLGEDWNSVRGGNSDLGAPVCCIGAGVVVLAREVHMGWGKVVLVRHAYNEFGRLAYVDSLYAHANDIFVREGQIVGRGQQIATIGTGDGMYIAHLHFEVHKNLGIGVNHASCARDFSNYYDPTAFIEEHRSLRGGGATTALIALNLPPASAGGEGSQMVFVSNTQAARVQRRPHQPFLVKNYRYGDIIAQEKEDLD